MGCEFEFPALTIAARRLGLDACDLAESVLHAIGCGQDEQEAIRMSIIETLQRRGAYRGRLKQAVDDGTIFQMTEGGLLDALDCLAVAPVVFTDGMDEVAVEFEARRAAKLDAVAVNGRD